MINKFSIITVCLNVEKVIESTILSVLNQTHTDYEYIFVDGISSDKTLEIINNYKPKFEEKGVNVKINSKKDTGIYNAMNKGIALATGEYLSFMNAGDAFFANDVLESVKDINDVDVIYGKTVLRGKKEVVEECNSIHYLKTGMPFCHQATFTKREYLIKNNFDESYKICADYKSFLQLYLEDGKFFYLDKIISIFSEDNKKLKNTLRLAGELAEIYNQCGLKKITPFKKRMIVFKAGFKFVIARILPSCLIKKIRMLRKKNREKKEKGN